ncbi:hypothetical protein BGZ47_002719 [Haplosporangium gracile]|nr:hypothetical protein BGZ47_002719 [Haplosporangium gracile]
MHVCSRIIFGYIATGCPRLETLKLKTDYYAAVTSFMGKDSSMEISYVHLHLLQLMGGFVLLSRLRQLKRLAINGLHLRMSIDCRDFDISGLPSLDDSL